MLGRKKKPTERLPWYRARNYKGDLTENEKRQLDSFRMRREHPAASYDTWPAPGSADTELGVLMEPEVCHGETEVYPGVQA